MRIYLARHGEAATSEIDSRHPLSDKGKKDVEAVGKFLHSLNIKPMHFFHSEELRAIQTAEIIAKEIDYAGEMQARAELEPIGLISPISTEINQGDEDVVLVGHMPFMGKLVSKLITGYENNDVVVFQTGTLACLERTNGNYWSILWVVAPELLIK
jgi:phosphohistidine phosphatase